VMRCRPVGGAGRRHRAVAALHPAVAGAGAAHPRDLDGARPAQRLETIVTAGPGGRAWPWQRRLGGVRAEALKWCGLLRWPPTPTGTRLLECACASVPDPWSRVCAL
jgi:hypothetical protein